MLEVFELDTIWSNFHLIIYKQYLVQEIIVINGNIDVFFFSIYFIKLIITHVFIIWQCA